MEIGHERLPLAVVIQGDADGTAMMTIILPDDTAGAQLPQPGVVIRAAGD